MASEIRLERDSGVATITLHAADRRNGWPVASELERASQMWSMRRKHVAGGDA